MEGTERLNRATTLGFHVRSKSELSGGYQNMGVIPWKTRLTPLRADFLSLFGIGCQQRWRLLRARPQSKTNL